MVTHDARTSGEFLKVKIDLPSFQLDIATRDPRAALGEVRRILEIMHLDDDVAYEEFVQQELRASFSDAFLRNQQAMASIKSLLKQEDGYRLATADIPITTTVDLDARTSTGRIARKDIRRAMDRLTRDLTGSEVKHGIVHVVGDLDKDSKLLIADHIHRAMPTAQLRAFHTRTDAQRVIVECVFFGDFPEDDED